MTATEARLLDRLNPLQQNDMKNIVDKAYEVSQAHVPVPDGVTPPPGVDAGRRNEWLSNDGHVDAFRHAYWNATMSNHFGADWTQQFATAHEGMPGNPGDREAMDLYNNHVGRQIAAEHPGASDEQMAGFVNDALKSGRLVVLDTHSQLEWSDRVPMWQHGLSDRGARHRGPAPAPRRRVRELRTPAMRLIATLLLGVTLMSATTLAAEFDPAAWRAQAGSTARDNPRGAMVPLLDGRIQRGMARSDVLKLLGPPDAEEPGIESYNAGASPFGIDPEMYVVRYDRDGRVLSAGIIRG